jgi:hypothetical protein
MSYQLSANIPKGFPMGYVKLKDICKFIPPAEIIKSAGTWTPTIALHNIYEARTAEAGGFYLFIPIKLPASDVGTQGAKLKSVDIWYKIATAAMADMAAVEIKRQTLLPNGTAVAGADYTGFTLDADHDTAAERKTIASHKMTLTFTDEPFLQDDEVYYIVITCEAAVTSAFSLIGAQVNFELRL